METEALPSSVFSKNLSDSSLAPDKQRFIERIFSAEPKQHSWKKGLRLSPSTAFPLLVDDAARVSRGASSRPQAPASRLLPAFSSVGVSTSALSPQKSNRPRPRTARGRTPAPLRGGLLPVQHEACEVARVQLVHSSAGLAVEVVRHTQTQLPLGMRQRELVVALMHEAKHAQVLEGRHQ